jgi:hypothetical protein
MKIYTKTRKYNYLLVIQGKYSSQYGFEDLAEYDRTEYKQARADLNEYRIAEPQYQHRIINRRELRSC